MKKALLLLAVALAFTLTAMAQTEGQAAGTPSQTTTTTKSKKSKKGSAATEQGAAKEATMTGCISAQPDANGMYTLSNGRHKKGVEVGPADKLQEHAGHQVKLTGAWTKAAAGETQAAAGKEKGKRHFEVASVTHISKTCAEAPGGGTASEKPAGKTAEGTPKGKKSKAAEQPPPPKP
jgi:hypothetical protein